MNCGKYFSIELSNIADSSLFELEDYCDYPVVVLPVPADRFLIHLKIKFEAIIKYVSALAHRVALDNSAKSDSFRPITLLEDRI
jgi:hypothetical protein